MSDDFLFNGGVWGDILLEAKTSIDYSSFDFAGFRRYLKYVTFQAGLNGLFTLKTARQIVEGYTDPLVEGLTKTPIYAGGDVTSSPFLSIDQGATNPADNKIAMYSGQVDGGDEKSYLLTRTYAKWLDNTVITMRTLDYTSINKT